MIVARSRSAAATNSRSQRGASPPRSTSAPPTTRRVLEEAVDAVLRVGSGFAESYAPVVEASPSFSRSAPNSRGASGTPAAAARELRRPQRLYEEVGADGHAERLAGELGQAG